MSSTNYIWAVNSPEIQKAYEFMTLYRKAKELWSGTADAILKEIADSPVYQSLKADIVGRQKDHGYHRLPQVAALWNEYKYDYSYADFFKRLSVNTNKEILIDGVKHEIATLSGSDKNWLMSQEISHPFEVTHWASEYETIDSDGVDATPFHNMLYFNPKIIEEYAEAHGKTFICSTDLEESNFVHQFPGKDGDEKIINIGRLFLGLDQKKDVLLPGELRGSSRVTNVRAAWDHLTRKDFGWYMRERELLLGLTPTDGILIRPEDSTTNMLYPLSPRDNCIYLLKDK